MEKVKLTREQAEAIEVFLDDNGNDKEHLVDWFVAKRGYRYSVDLEYRALADLKTSILSKALYAGYEIEPDKPKFKVGDKVMYGTIDDEVFAISKDLGNKRYMCVDGDEVDEQSIRHATPEEIYWLETLGRKYVWDFRKGDIVLSSLLIPRILTEPHDFEYAVSDYNAGSLISIYPAESFKPFPKDSE